MADLSSHFTFTESSSTDIDGLDLPDVSPGSFIKNKPDKCLACPKATEHGNCLKDLSLAQENIKHADQKLIDLRNEFPRNMRKFQQLRQRLAFACGSSNMGKDRQTTTNTAIFARWKVVSVAGNRITCVYRTGSNGVYGVTDANPLSLVYQVFSQGAFDESEGALHIETIGIRIRKNGKARFLNCMLGFHRGAEIVEIEIPVSSPADMVDGTQFVLVADQTFSSGGLATYPPDSEEPPIVDYEFYVGEYQNPQQEPKEIEGMFATKKTVELDIPEDKIFVLEEEKLIANPQKNSTAHLFKAYKMLGNGRVDISSDARQHVKITWDNDAGVYVSKCDLSSMDLDLAEKVAFEYWVNDPSNSSAENIDVFGCSKFSNTGTWGYGCLDASESPTGLANLNDSPAIRAKQCHQPCGGCDKFNAIVPHHPLDRRFYNDLLIKSGFYWRQVFAGISKAVVAGNDNYSLKMMTEPMYTAPGYHEYRLFMAGGWMKAHVVDGVLTERPGWEMMWDDGSYGAAGNNWSRSSALDDHDSGTIVKSQILTSSPDIHAYRASIDNAYGTFQRNVTIDIAIPDIRKPNNYYFPGGHVVFNYFDEDFQLVPPDTGAVVYTSYIQLLATNPYARYWNENWERTKHSPKVIHYTHNAETNTYALHLENLVVECSSQSSAQEETVTQFKVSGTNVSHRNANRIANWLCDQSKHGPMANLYQVGDVISFPGMPSDNKFYITKATPACGIKQSWQPGADTPSKVIVSLSGLKYIDVPSPETIESVSVTRASGSVNMTAWTGNFPKVHLDKDHFFYTVVEEGSSNRVYFKFSNENLTTNAADSTDFDLTVTTDVGTHTALDFNWYHDSTYGAGVLTTYLWQLPRNIFDHVTSVKFRFTDPDSKEDVYTVLNEVAPTASLSGLAYNQYYKTQVNDFAIYFTFPADVLGTGELVLEATETVITPWESDEAWAHSNVWTLHASSLPTATWTVNDEPLSFVDYGNNSDVIEVRDEQGMIADWIAGGGTPVGENITGGTLGVAHYNPPTSISMARAYTSAEDVELEPSDYAWLGALGRCYLKPILRNGDCIYIRGAKMCRRELMPLTNEQQSIVSTFEGLLDNGLTFGLGGPPTMTDGTLFPETFEYSASRVSIFDGETKELTTTDFPQLPYPMDENPSYGEGPYQTVEGNSFAGSLYDIFRIRGVSDRVEEIEGVTYYRTGFWITTFLSMRSATIRSEQLDYCGKSLKDYVDTATLNVAFAPAPTLHKTVHEWWIDDSDEPFSPFDSPMVVGTDGTAWQHYNSTTTTADTAGVTIAMASVYMDANGDLVLRDMGVGLGYSVSDEGFHAVTVTDCVKAYIAAGTRAPAFCFFACTNLGGETPAFGGSLQSFLDTLFEATCDLSDIGTYTWFSEDETEHHAVLEGSITTTQIIWGLITTSNGKVRFTGCGLNSEWDLSYGDIPPVIR